MIPRDCAQVLVDNAGGCRRLYPSIVALTLTRVVVISGGVLAWIEEGSSVITDKGHALNGPCSCKLRPRKPYPKKKMERRHSKP